MRSEGRAQCDDITASAESHSEDQATFPVECGSSSNPSGTQPSLHVQSSREGDGSEGQPDDGGEGLERQEYGGEGEGEGLERQEHGGEGENVQGQHSNAPQLGPSQQPLEQHQSLTGNSMLRDPCSHCIQARLCCEVTDTKMLPSVLASMEDMCAYAVSKHAEHDPALAAHYAAADLP